MKKDFTNAVFRGKMAWSNLFRTTSKQVTMNIIYPPRPKGKMLYTDLPYYESTGKWIAQRKFRGSRAVIFISPEREITLGSRHGRSFAKFSLNKAYKQEILSGLNLKDGASYWLDAELMNKDENATNELILFDVLQEGHYFFSGPNQTERLQILNRICNSPKEYCANNIALKVTDRVWMAETFDSNFMDRYKEALPIKQLEGLVLRKKNSTLDNFGYAEYETTNLIRCRKAFGLETPRAGRSGGYEF